MDYIEVVKESHPIKNGKWVKCVAQIRHNESGEIREYETDEILMDNEPYPSVFNWQENNYSCDCNRLLFFKRAGKEETESDWDVECTDGKYSVNLKNKKNGEIYYREYGV